MVDIGTSDKITNLWPATPTRSKDKSGFKDKSNNQQPSKNKRQSNNSKEDEAGKNIDEYA